MRFLAFFVFFLWFLSSFELSTAQDNIGSVSEICTDPTGVCSSTTTDPTAGLPIPSCSSVADCDSQIAHQQTLLASAVDSYYAGYYQRCIDALTIIRSGLLSNPGVPLATCTTATECLSSITYYSQLLTSTLSDPSTANSPLVQWYYACITNLQLKYVQLSQQVGIGGGGGGGGSGSGGGWNDFQNWLKCLDKIDCCMAQAVQAIGSGGEFSYDRLQGWTDCNTKGSTSCGNRC